MHSAMIGRSSYGRKQTRFLSVQMRKGSILQPHSSASPSMAVHSQTHCLRRLRSQFHRRTGLLRLIRLSDRRRGNEESLQGDDSHVALACGIGPDMQGTCGEVSHYRARQAISMVVEALRSRFPGKLGKWYVASQCIPLR
jgi:hypothetical protein